MTSYTSTTVWLLICVIGIGTFGLRFTLIALADRGDRIPDSIQRALRFIPPAVLAAIAAPAFLLVDDAIDVTTSNAAKLEQVRDELDDAEGLRVETLPDKGGDEAGAEFPLGSDPKDAR